MKVWISILVFGVSNLLVESAESCPSDHYSAIFVATVDKISDGVPRIGFSDPDLVFFKNVMKFTDTTTLHIFEDAIKFFNETHGLDFSLSPPNEKKEYFYENAVMGPFILSDELDFIVTSNNWIQSGSTRSTCYRIRGGGLCVAFTGNQTLHGIYGGADGKPVAIGNTLAYGFYSIDVCKQSPVIIQFECSIPVRMEPIEG